MANYRRLYRAGGTYFITVVTHGRRPLFDDPTVRRCLREAVDAVRARHLFEIDEFVLLRDHFHLILTLLAGETDFSLRVSQIKASFTRSYMLAGGDEGTQSDALTNKRYRGV